MEITFSSCYLAPINLPKGHQAEIETGDHSTILFVLSGTVSVPCVDYGQTKMNVTNGMIFLPRGHHYILKAIESASYVKNETTITFIKNVSRWLAQVSENDINNKNQNYILPLKHNVRCFLDLVRQYNSTMGFRISEMAEWKQNGLFLVLKNTYSTHELASFFSSIQGVDLDFKGFVYANYESVRNVLEFADLAKCSLSVFCREFKRNFGESAYQWMLKRKSNHILRDILQTSIPFQELAEKYQFSSQAHFTKFCKQRYNLTPKDLRNSDKNDIAIYINEPFYFRYSSVNATQ